MIDTQADPSLTNIEDAKMRLTYPEWLVVGNSVRFDIELFTLARHLAPEPGSSTTTPTSSPLLTCVRPR